MKPPHDEFNRVWRTPLWLAGLTAFGLLAALLGTGPWRWAAWIALGAPLATALRLTCQRRT
jgi:hypothetical protein